MSACISLRRARKSPPKIKAVLAGFPNAGKTTLFNALTKSRLKTGNFHGVTVRPFEKQVGDMLFADVPGAYSFNGYTMEEGCVWQTVEGCDLVINVIDALTLESSLVLTRRIIAARKPTVIFLTKLKALKRRGGWVDEGKLAAHLGVPVFVSVKSLKAFLERLKTDGRPADLSICGRQKCALDEAYYGGNCNLGKMEGLFYNAYFALFFFFAALIFTFFITFHPAMPGAKLKAAFEGAIVENFSRFLSSLISDPWLKNLVCEGIVGGVGGVLSFIPQISILYLTLIILDESGISSALTFVTDGLFAKVGLSGRAAFSLVSGLGCTAAAISTTRGYREDSSRRRTVAVLPFVPCGAKLPVFLTLLSPVFADPFPAVCALYFSGVALAVIASALFRGKGEEPISEIAPVAPPSPAVIIKKLCFQIKSFIIKLTTFVFVFAVIGWVLSHVSLSRGLCEPGDSVLGAFCKLICVLFRPMGISDWRIAYAAVCGFAAKENVAAALAQFFPAGLNLSFASSLALCTFFLGCPACITAFAASVREVGLKTTAKYNLFQLIFSFISAYLIYFILSLI